MSDYGQALDDAEWALKEMRDPLEAINVALDRIADARAALDARAGSAGLRRVLVFSGEPEADLDVTVVDQVNADWLRDYLEGLLFSLASYSATVDVIPADARAGSADSLDAAWKRVEDALPEGWAVSFRQSFDHQWFLAAVMSQRSSLRLTEGLGDDEGAIAVEGEGTTPAAALNALADALRAAERGTEP